MSDEFTVVSNQSWFSRLGSAIKGVFIGIILFIVAFPVLFWNEGRSVKTYKSLKEGAGAVVEVSADTVDPANAGKLIHITGDAVTAAPVVDPDLKLSVEALKLIRDVEIYQWKESESTSTKKNTGGSTTKETKYSYDKSWVSSPIDSSSFKKPDGHTNTGTLPLSNKEIVANPITVGAFTLNQSLVGSISKKTPFKVEEMELPSSLGENAKIANGSIYIGVDPSNPAIGDVRISFASVPPGPVSVVAQQVASTFEPYTAKKGGKPIHDLRQGTLSAAAMFEKLQSENKMKTWLMRLLGFALMGIGLSLVFKPLSVLADVIPFIGNIVGAGTSMISFLIAFCCSTVTIAIAWVVYRPILGVTLLVLAVGSIILVVTKLKGAKKAAEVPAQA